MSALLRGPHRAPAGSSTQYRGLRVRHDSAELARVRSFAHDAAARFGFDRATCEQFKLAANEAVSNAIEHGSPCNDGAIHLCIAEGDSALTLSVCNRGEFLFNPPPSDPLAERGRGLTLIADLVDTVALTCIGNDVIQVELTKERPSGSS